MKKILTPSQAIPLPIWLYHVPEVVGRNLELGITNSTFPPPRALTRLWPPTNPPSAASPGPVAEAVPFFRNLRRPSAAVSPSPTFPSLHSTAGPSDAGGYADIQQTVHASLEMVPAHSIAQVGMEMGVPAVLCIVTSDVLAA
jgi:hypothetical protein